MTEIYPFFLEPFIEFGFMRRALSACFSLSIGCAPIGVILVLKRMSLIGDAMSHAILPGAAIGFMISGFSLISMSIGGFTAALSIALLSNIISKYTRLLEDASFASFYLISLAIGVLLITMYGSSVDLMHVLFGTILAVDNNSLFLIAIISSITLITLATIYRPLVIQCFDENFLKSNHNFNFFYHTIFMILVVFNLVGGFQALGTLMCVGLMMLPAIAAKFWAKETWSLMLLSAVFAFLSGYFGLIISYHWDLSSGPSIILFAGFIYIVSIFLGKEEGILQKIFQKQHFQA